MNFCPFCNSTRILNLSGDLSKYGYRSHCYSCGQHWIEEEIKEDNQK